MTQSPDPMGEWTGGQIPQNVKYLMLPQMSIAYTYCKMFHEKKKVFQNVPAIVFFVTWQFESTPEGGTKIDTAHALPCHVVIITTKFDKFLQYRLEADRVTDGRMDRLQHPPWCFFFFFMKSGDN